MLAIELPTEDWEAIHTDVRRAALNAALDVENLERQGIAADMNRLAEIIEAALIGSPESSWER